MFNRKDIEQRNCAEVLAVMQQVGRCVLELRNADANAGGCKPINRPQA